MRSLKIPASDGYELAAHVFGEAAAKGRAWVVIAPATGVPQGFYRRFAQYLTDEGYGVVSFDYRGVGASAPATLRGFDASFLDWAHQDLTSVVTWARERADVAVVGHSFGGQAYGLLSPELKLLGLCAFGTGNGWHGHMAPLERVKILAMWHLLAPALTRVYGYLPSQLVGLGEPLPMGVYRQWKRWCASEHHWFEDTSFDARGHFDRVRSSVLAINASDDPWAGPRSARTFMQHYRHANLELRTVTPSELGVSTIGHMGYFRAPVGQRLWPQVTAWLRRLEARA